jgi:hypothetical protein
MSRGILYVMTTVVPGLVKIGKTGSGNFEQRMYGLERNGYFNVVGLKRRFAIEVEDYDEKEVLLDEIFSKSRVPGSELFALDIDLVVQLLSSLEGRQVYPATETKEEAFDRATEERHVKDDWALVPNGIYHLRQKDRAHGPVEAQMEVKDGSFIVKAGCKCLPVKDGAWAPEARKNAPIADGMLESDYETNAPSTAAWVVLGHAANGWMVWRDSQNKPIDRYRKRKRSQ